MIIYEIAIAVLFLVVLIVGINVCGKPIATGYGEKIKNRYKEIGSAEGDKLWDKISSLDAEVQELKRELVRVNELLEFTTNLAQSNSDNKVELFSRSEPMRQMNS
ncbi:MAG: hypothetical protein K2X81_24395 [Candidatus Obscuribacterales bacterium]|nr:hypothetical protein [Candidatus Obscuribacterales bacterium]